LPGQIDAKEQQIAAVEAQMADAGFYSVRPLKPPPCLATLNQANSTCWSSVGPSWMPD
jgi:ATP-binding cassette subfamily F protein uup